MSDGARRLPRQVGLEPHLAELLPELIFGITPEQLAMLAGRAMTPRPEIFADMMATAKFGRVSVRPMSGGIVAMHSGWRL